MSIIIGLIVVGLLSAIALAGVVLRRRLATQAMKDELPGGEDERPQHLAIGTSEQLESMRSREASRS